MGQPAHHSYLRESLILPSIGKSLDLSEGKKNGIVISELSLRTNHPFKEQNHNLFMKIIT